MPFQIFVKKPLIPSQILRKISSTFTPIPLKKSTNPCPKPFMNSQIPRKIFFIALQILVAMFCICVHASDQSPLSIAHTNFITSMIAFATSKTALKNGPSAAMIPLTTPTTTPYSTSMILPIKSNTGFKS